MSVTTIRHQVIDGGFKVVTTAFDGSKFYAVFQVYKQYDNGMLTLEKSVRYDNEERGAVLAFDTYI